MSKSKSNRRDIWARLGVVAAVIGAVAMAAVALSSTGLWVLAYGAGAVAVGYAAWRQARTVAGAA